MQKHFNMHVCHLAAVGISAGLVCGLLGAGGGLILIPLLRKSNILPSHLHATCMAVMIPLSLLSGWLYIGVGHLSMAEVLPYLPGGILGALLGGFLLPRINSTLLRRIFGLFLIYAGVRQLGLLSLVGL